MRTFANVYKKKAHRIVLIGVSCVAVGLFVLFSFRAALSEYVWRTHHLFPEYTIHANSNNPNVLIDIGHYYYGLGAYDVAIARLAFTQALVVDDQIPYANHQLARIAFVEGKFDLALQYINRELELFPGHLHAYYVRGLIYGFRGTPEDLSKAENDFRYVIERDTSSWGPYNDLAWVLALQGKHQEVAATVETAFAVVAQADTNPWLLNSLGAAYLNMGEYQNAIEYLTLAQAEAATLDVVDWRSAYSGNDPQTDAAGLAAFKDAIDQNLKIAKKEAVK